MLLDHTGRPIPPPPPRNPNDWLLGEPRSRKRPPSSNDVLSGCRPPPQDSEQLTFARSDTPNRALYLWGTVLVCALLAYGLWRLL
jgi:hypothetical protein